MDPKILIALQFWEGDKSRAMALARYLADLEPAHSERADFLFAARFDCVPDPATVSYVARKFNVFSIISRRRTVGWPAGCNDLWFSVMEWVQAMTAAGKIPKYKAVFTCEADGGPTQKNWTEWMSLEWERVNQERPVIMAGALLPPITGCTDRWHINGNALMSGNANFLYWIGRKVGCCSANIGWDFGLAPDFERLGWADVPGMRSIYNQPGFSRERFEEFVRTPLFWVHGCKDDSLIRHGRRMFQV